MEYDFTWPKRDNDAAGDDRSFRRGDVLHVQWTGSDANPPGNAGNGRRQTDRSNLVQMSDPAKNHPLSLLNHDDVEGGVATQIDMDLSMFDDAETVHKLAYLGQTTAKMGCDHSPEVETQAQNVKNCAQLNAAPAYFDGGLVPLTKQGTFYVFSTRNTDFTNRSQKAKIVVKTNPYLIAAGVIGGLAALLGLALCYSKRRSWAKKLHDKHVIGEGTRGRIERGAHIRETLGMGESGEDAGPPPGCCARHCAALRDWWAWNQGRALGFLVFLLLNFLMFFWGYVKHDGVSDLPYLPWAKGGGFMLNFNCSPVKISQSIFTHWGLEWGHRPAQEPSAPQIGSQRLCIRE